MANEYKTLAAEVEVLMSPPAASCQIAWAGAEVLMGFSASEADIFWAGAEVLSSQPPKRAQAMMHTF